MSRRRSWIAGLAAAAAVVAAVPPAGADAAPAQTRIGVRGDEFNLILSRTTVRPGWGYLQFQNAGEDPHDLKVRRIGLTGELATGEVLPGLVVDLPRLWLKRGASYRLWCSLENHVSYGMEATLKVKRKRRRR